eukprot:c23005_g1_i1 orf=865-1923(+)
MASVDSISLVHQTTGFPHRAYELKIPQEAYWVLFKLALKWTDIVDAKNLTVRPLKGAMTNEIFECIWARGDARHPRKVLVRVYGQGTDLFFNREDEIRIFECMSRMKQGPRLLGRFPNGRIEEFLHARTLSASDLQNPRISASIAVKLREFHQLNMPGSCQPHLWQRLRDWLQKALTLCQPEHVEEFNLRRLEAEIEELRNRISKPQEELGFCHNDLQYGNAMIDDEEKFITIIDYEYSSYNPVAYDLANHFCELAADYHTSTPHVLDYSKYPDFQERCRFIEVYLKSSDANASQLEIEELARETDHYALASHIHWGLWGIISACVNEIDFDYMEYARQRFDEYYRSKAKLF